MEELDAGVVGQVLAGSPDAVVIVDRDGVIRYWNRGAERIFGHPASEAVGATLDLIVPERLRERHWEGFNRTMETGETRYGDDDLLAVPAAAAGGRTISVEFSVVLVEPEGGGRYIGAVMRDVSERRRRDQELRRELEELRAR